MQNGTRCWLIAVLPILMLACTESIHSPSSNTNVVSDKSVVEHASAEDCEIIVEVGKAELNWGKNSYDTRFYPDWDRPRGGKYTEDCPWKKLGVAPIFVDTKNRSSAYITRPIYAGDNATVEFGSRVESGTQIPPFLSLEKCKLHRNSWGHWHLVACELSMIT